MCRERAGGENVAGRATREEGNPDRIIPEVREMANVAEKIRFLEEYRKYPEKYLPLTDHAWKHFEKVDYGTEWYDDPWYNLGWDAGLLEGNRPYFLECWATCGITMLTYFVSTEGIEGYGVPELLAMLEKAKLVKVLDPANPRTAVKKFRDDSGREFFSINITVGVEDETYVSGGTMYPFAALNRYNRKREKEEKAE